MRIGVVSDSHYRNGGRLPSLAAVFQQLDLILHAGDVGDETFITWLKQFAPVEWVAGNCDTSLAATHWPRKRLLTLEGHRIGLIHGDGSGGSTPQRAAAAFRPEQVAAVVFGHSHQPYNQRQQDGLLLFNPGSVNYPRGQAPQSSCGILTLTADGIQSEIIYL